MTTRGRTALRCLGLAAALTIVVAACARGDADDTTPSTGRAPDPTGSASPTTASDDGTESTTTDAGDPTDDTSGTDATGSTSTSPTSTSGGTQPSVDPSDATPVSSVTELIERGDDLLGRVVTLRAKAFFLEECPPPDGAAGPCSLLLFIGDASRDGLLYGERDQAVPGYLDGVRVSCEVGPETRTACAGWEQGAEYEIVGVVRQPEFGRQVELDISRRIPT